MTQTLGAWKTMHAKDNVDTSDLLARLREVHAADPAAYAKTWIPYLSTLTWKRRRADQWYRNGLTAESSLEALESNHRFAPFLRQSFELAINSKPKRAKLLDALIASPLLAVVDELVLSGCNVTDDVLTALCKSPHFTKVSVLRLDDNAFTSKGIVKLMSSHGARLVELDLSSNVLDRKAIEAVARAPKLKILRLGGTELGDAGVAALTKHLAGSLEELELIHNDLTPASARALAESPKLASLRKLALFDNALKDEGVKALVSSKHLAKLTHLDLGKNKLTKVAGSTLAGASFRSLVDLSLDSNDLGNDGVTALVGSASFAAVTKLSLQWTKITDAGAVALAGARTRLPVLKRLQVRGNKIGATGKSALDAVPGVMIIVK